MYEDGEWEFVKLYEQDLRFLSDVPLLEETPTTNTTTTAVVVAEEEGTGATEEEEGDHTVAPEKEKER